MLDADDLFEGAICSAVFPSDGMWYEAVVERRLSEEEASSDYLNPYVIGQGISN